MDMQYQKVLNYKRPSFWLVIVAIIALIITAVCFLTDPVKEQPEDSQPSLYEVTLRDGIANEPYWISFIYWMEKLGEAETVTIHDADAGQTTEVSYDLEFYTISDSAGKRTYQHCVKSLALSEYGSVTEYFFLTDDPDMTAGKYLSGEVNLPTEVLYIDHRSFDAAEIFGNIPPEIEALMTAQEGATGTFYCPDSVFCVKYRFDTDSTHYSYSLERLDYAENLLCSSDVRCVPQRVLELEDGGFAVITYSFQDGQYALCCYNALGAERWEYDFEYEGRVYVSSLYELSGDIYCFGIVGDKNNSDDIYIWRINPEGQLVKEKHFSGSDFESIHRVLETDSGFTLYGNSQSGDGDFPFSKDGFGECFVAQVSTDLELISARKAESRYDALVGYYKGNPVFGDEPILDRSWKDKLPEGMLYGSASIFDWEDGYVVVRQVYYGIYPYDHPHVGRVLYYGQKIVTGYDAGGNPLWQTAGGIQAG